MILTQLTTSLRSIPSLVTRASALLRTAIAFARLAPRLPVIAATPALIAAFSVLAAATATADDVQRAAISADRFLGAQKTGTLVLSYVHFGARYRSHQFTTLKGVNDRSGNPVPGEFALIYRYKWDDDGVSDVAFLCNSQGKVYQVQVPYTNAIIQQPFFAANATIQVLGNVLIGAFGDDMTAEQKRNYQKLVDNADAKGMLELSIQLQQVLR